MTSFARPWSLRRILGAVVGVMLTASAVTACGSDVDGNSDADGGGKQDDYYPVTVSSSSGDVTIESEPRNVVTVGDQALENVVSLDIEPSAAFVEKSFYEKPYLEKWHESDFLVGDSAAIWNDIDVESIAASDPDLIIISAWMGEQGASFWGQLSDIAPTVVFDTDQTSDSWEVGYMQVSEALNEVDRAKSRIDDLDEATRAARDEVSDLEGSSFTAGAMTGDSITLSSSSMGLFESLGLEPSELQLSVLESEGNSLTISPENFRKLDADIVYVGSVPEGVDPENIPASNPLSLIDGRLVFPSSALTSAFYTGGALGHIWGIGEVPELISER